MILLTGFGAFRDVTDNPAARAARALSGWRLRGHTVVSRVIPVSYARGPDHTIAVARQLRPVLVLGLGVAVARAGVEVERRAVARVQGADVDGVTAELGPDPAEVRATIDVAALGEALGAGLSDDAGAYVCNAWLYRVTQALDAPVGFVHVPRDGIEPERLARGLAALVAG